VRETSPVKGSSKLQTAVEILPDNLKFGMLLRDVFLIFSRESGVNVKETTLPGVDFGDGTSTMNLVVMLEDGHLITENFPIKLVREN